MGGCQHVSEVDEDCRTAPANRASAVGEPRTPASRWPELAALQACKQQSARAPSDCRSGAQTGRHSAFRPVGQSAGFGHKQRSRHRQLGAPARARRQVSPRSSRATWYSPISRLDAPSAQRCVSETPPAAGLEAGRPQCCRSRRSAWGRLQCEKQFPPLGCLALAFLLWPAFPVER
jgi:hypothetical protein